MKVVVFGGTGHVSRYTVPMLVDAGYEVIVSSRGIKPVPTTGKWAKVKHIACDFNNEDSLEPLKALRPEIVINMLDPKCVYNKFKSCAKHVISCGSLWMLGEPLIVPTPEVVQAPPKYYGPRMEFFTEVLEGPKDGALFTGILPPNICGPGQIPLECLGGRDIEVHKQHAAGKKVILPDGPDALIGPCDAEDIANCFMLAVLNPDKAAFEMFNVGSAYALSATQFVATYAKIYNTHIPIKKVSWRDYTEKISPHPTAWWHFKAHMCPDISKAKKLLGYEPKYTPEQTMARAVDWMREEKLI